MIRIRVHPVIALGLLVLIGGLILVGVLPGGPFGSPSSSPTVPTVVVPARPTIPGREELPDGVTAFTGDVQGEPHQLFVDANSNAQEGDVQVIYDGATENDQGLQARMRVSSGDKPGGQVNLYVGDRFEFDGYVFEVDRETNAWRLVLNVWAP